MRTEELLLVTIGSAEVTVVGGGGQISPPQGPPWTCSQVQGSRAQMLGPDPWLQILSLGLGQSLNYSMPQFLLYTSQSL